MALGERLFGLRRTAGLTQGGLADAAGLHWTYMGRSSAVSNPTYKNLLKLAAGVGVEPSGLLNAN